MPHSPELIERMLKEAGLFDNVKSWFSGFFAPKPPGSKEKKRALSRVDAHFGAKEKDWDRLVDNASRKSFAKAIAGDSRADAKLKMHVDNLNRLKTGKVLGTIQGTEGSRTARRDGSQSYKIIKLRGSDRLGCTCRDWRFKKSVAQPGEQVDCKHIRQFKQMNKIAAHPTYTAQLTSLSSQEQSKLLKEEAQKAKKYGRRDFWKDPRYRAEVSLKFPKLFPGKRSWRELTDRDFDKIVRHYRKCRTDRDRYMALRMELGALGLPKDVWRQKVRAVVGTLPVEQMNKTASYGELKKEAAELTTRGRNQISEGNFALPGRRYPIHDRSHARNALARVAQHGTPAEKAQVRKAVAAKYPGIEQDKQAGHVEDRIAERAPGSTYEVARIQASIPSMNLRKGQTYHVPLKGGKGYAVIGDIGPKHVVKTVLGPNMRPPGNRAKVARAPRDYKREYEQYHGKPEQVANRSMRNQARRKMGLKNGDPREVDHQTPLSKGGGNGKSNLRAISRHANRTKFTDEK